MFSFLRKLFNLNPESIISDLQIRRLSSEVCISNPIITTEVANAITTSLNELDISSLNGRLNYQVRYDTIIGNYDSISEKCINRISTTLSLSDLYLDRLKDGIINFLSLNEIHCQSSGFHRMKIVQLRLLNDIPNTTANWHVDYNFPLNSFRSQCTLSSSPDIDIYSEIVPELVSLRGSEAFIGDNWPRRLLLELQSDHNYLKVDPSYVIFFCPRLPHRSSPIIKESGLNYPRLLLECIPS
jgi:hypothetical protein